MSAQKPTTPFNTKLIFTWLVVVSSLMIFMGLTSGYIVIKGESTQQFKKFDVPTTFLYSTIIVLLSSFTLWMAQRNAASSDVKKVKLFLVATFLLGVLFIGSQFLAFKEMVANELYLTGTSKGASFTYVIPIVHIAHILLGLILIGITLFKAYKFEVHSKRMTGIKVTSIFWHFLSVIWVYLYALLWYLGKH